jgi:hypothetical protein
VRVGGEIPETKASYRINWQTKGKTNVIEFDGQLIPKPEHFLVTDDESISKLPRV